MIRRGMNRAEWAPYRCRTPLFRLIGYFVTRSAPAPDHRLILSFRDSHNAAETYVASILVLVHLSTAVSALLWPAAGPVATALLLPVAMLLAVPGAELMTAMVSRTFRFVLKRFPAERLRIQEASQAVLMTLIAAWLYRFDSWHRLVAVAWLAFMALNVLALVVEPFLRRSYERLTQRLEGRSA